MDKQLIDKYTASDPDKLRERAVALAESLERSDELIAELGEQLAGEREEAERQRDKSLETAEAAYEARIAEAERERERAKAEAAEAYETLIRRIDEREKTAHAEKAAREQALEECDRKLAG